MVRGTEPLFRGRTPLMGSRRATLAAKFQDVVPFGQIKRSWF
jgi:hypothetical protein